MEMRETTNFENPLHLLRLKDSMLNEPTFDDEDGNANKDPKMKKYVLNWLSLFLFIRNFTYNKRKVLQTLKEY